MTIQSARLTGLLLDYEIQEHPHICEVATRMALDNDCINRQETIDQFYAKCDEVLCDKSNADLKRLDFWLASLTDEELDTLADGEETERLALENTGPKGGPDNQPLSKIFEDIFEVM